MSEKNDKTKLLWRHVHHGVRTHGGWVVSLLMVALVLAAIAMSGLGLRAMAGGGDAGWLLPTCLFAALIVHGIGFLAAREMVNATGFGKFLGSALAYALPFLISVGMAFAAMHHLLAGDASGEADVNRIVQGLADESANVESGLNNLASFADRLQTRSNIMRMQELQNGNSCDSASPGGQGSVSDAWGALADNFKADQDLLSGMATALSATGKAAKRLSAAYQPGQRAALAEALGEWSTAIKGVKNDERIASLSKRLNALQDSRGSFQLAPGLNCKSNELQGLVSEASKAIASLPSGTTWNGLPGTGHNESARRAAQLITGDRRFDSRLDGPPLVIAILPELAILWLMFRARRRWHSPLATLSGLPGAAGDPQWDTPAGFIDQLNITRQDLESFLLCSVRHGNRLTFLVPIQTSDQRAAKMLAIAQMLEHAGHLRAQPAFDASGTAIWTATAAVRDAVCPDQPKWQPFAGQQQLAVLLRVALDNELRLRPAPAPQPAADAERNAA